jgi:hypothetical protein
LNIEISLRVIPKRTFHLRRGKEISPGVWVLSGGHVSGGLFLEFEVRKFRNLERLTCASRERDGDAKTEEDDDRKSFSARKVSPTLG